MASSKNFDEYLDWLLEDGPPILPTVVQNILDEPIPEAVKKRLLKPLLPRNMISVTTQRTTHATYSTENKKVVGKLKDECNGRPITEFVGLHPKMYSILEVNEENIRKAKGVQKTVVKKDLRHVSCYTSSA